MIRDDPSRSELIRPGLAVRVDPVRLLYLPYWQLLIGVNIIAINHQFHQFDTWVFGNLQSLFPLQYRLKVLTHLPESGNYV